MSYDLSSEKGVNNIIHCYNEFQKLRITPSLYEHDRPASIDFLKNLSKTYKEISDEIDAEMEDEAVMDSERKKRDSGIGRPRHWYD